MSSAMPSNDANVNVFAYGSNMCTQRMRQRAATATPLTIGYVRQRRLQFRKRSEDGSAKADAALTVCATDRVWGVVYELHQHDKPLLDQHEFLGVGYDEQLVQVVHANGIVDAWMYYARCSAIDTSLLPYSWYHDLIIYGACQHRLPSDYIDQLKRFRSSTDPDAIRHAVNRRIIDA